MQSTYRDAEQYLARYQSLMTKALHLLEVGFDSRLDKVSSEISPKIAATHSESARHALAYGRFEELIAESYSLLPNVRKVVLNAYDHAGNARLGPNFDVYSNTVNSIFLAYLNARDRLLRPSIQHDFDTFKAEAKGDSVESAARNLVKECFERAFSEENLFTTIFSVEPAYNPDPTSVYSVLKSNNRTAVNPVNIVPLATALQSALQSAPLQTICNVVGWVTNEYLLLEYDEDGETGFTRHCRELAARLLTEHLLAFADKGFEAEIDKSIARAAVGPEALTIGPVAANGVASSNAYPPIRRALELLVMFDQCMPKERSVCFASIFFTFPSPLPTSLTPPIITAAHHLTNPHPPLRVPRLPPARDDPHPLRPQRDHGPGPVHDQEPPHPQERARLPRDRALLVLPPPGCSDHLFLPGRRGSRRAAALLPDLGLDLLLPLLLRTGRTGRFPVRAGELHPAPPFLVAPAQSRSARQERRGGKIPRREAGRHPPAEHLRLHRPVGGGDPGCQSRRGGRAEGEGERGEAGQGREGAGGRAGGRVRGPARGGGEAEGGRVGEC